MAIAEKCEKAAPNRRCYHHIEVKPENIGRVLGIGLRVAGRVAGERMSGSTGAAPDAAATVNRAAVDSAVRVRNAGQTASRARGGILRGVGGFLRPFGRVGGILWLEVTGVFFLIFVPVFAWRGMWPARASFCPWAGAFEVSRLHRTCACFSLSGRELVLAGCEEVKCHFLGRAVVRMARSSSR